MTGFHEVRFPEDISFGSSGGPEYSTDIVITNSGHEQRNINWQEARSVYNVAHGVKTQQQLEELISFFRARKGRAHGFRFKDWSDYKAIKQHIDLADGQKTEFKLVKTYENAGVTEKRLINKPVEDSLDVYLDGSLYQDNIIFNTEKGIIIFDIPPAAGVAISADFEFDVPVRFDTDRLSAKLDSYGVSSWINIPLIELRT